MWGTHGTWAVAEPVPGVKKAGLYGRMGVHSGGVMLLILTFPVFLCARLILAPRCK